MLFRWPRRRVRMLAGAATAAVVLAGTVTWTTAASGAEPEVHRENLTLSVPESPGSERSVRLDASYFTAGAPSRNRNRPAVLLGHGFGGSKNDPVGQAEQLARDGFAVMTWTARGFGASTGSIGLNDPDREVADVSRLIDWLAKRPEVRLDKEGDPRVGVAGASYGGAVSLLAAGYDDRVDAIAPAMTYWNLADALFPNGVFKKLWAGIFFTTGSTAPGGLSGGGAGAAAGAEAGGEGARAGGAGAEDAGNDGNGGGGGEDGPVGGRPPGGAPAATADTACGRFEEALCEMYQRVAVAGEPDAEARRMLQERSPSKVADRIDVPTLIVQGQSDSLFPLDHADAMAEAISDNGAPVAVDWIPGGHDGGNRETTRVEGRISSWFDRYLKDDEAADTGPVFRVSRSGGLDTTDGETRVRAASSDRYPGLDGSSPRRVRLVGPTQTFANPAGGTPSAISALPGLGSLNGLSRLGVGLSLDFPGQHAAFQSAPLSEDVRVTGTPKVRLRIAGAAGPGAESEAGPEPGAAARSKGGARSEAGDAVLFAKVYDIGPGGASQVLPAQLVTPLRAPTATSGDTGGDTDTAGEPGTAKASGGTGRTGGAGSTGGTGGEIVEVTLPAIDHSFAAGHRMRLVVAASDLGYASPVAPATYTVSVEGGELTVPTAPDTTTAAAPLPWWTWGLPVIGAVTAAVLLLSARRRAGPAEAPDPALYDVPLQITNLSKRYAKSADRYAVRDLSFRVERGQVLGLLGPNGAGKTTTLRMLMGLITPDSGEIRVFGHAIRPGAPVLSRVGAFVEGAGFLPHLSGRANLELYWRATGRPAQDAHIEEALEIADLGDALKRAVRTYSQGMRQRLAIAQAMLGLPDLLILDEPTNGLDPPQIREMRDVMIRYAAEGRTVIVSSHLLAEVEQTCSHLVVMDRGQLVQAGPVAQIVGTGDALLVGTTEDVADAALEKVEALAGVGSVRRAERGFAVTLDGMSVPELLAELVRLEIPVQSFGPNHTLEDAFLTLIGGAS